MTNQETTPLTKNGVSILVYSNTNQPTQCSYTFQVLSVEKGPIDDGPDCFKITLSDGQQFIKGLLAYESNGIGNKLSKYDIVGLSLYYSVTNSDKALILFYDLFVKHSGIEEKIGKHECFLLSSKRENNLQTEPTPPSTHLVAYYSTPQTSSPLPPSMKSFTLIDDWMVLASGYIQGIVQMPSPPHITIHTSLPLVFVKENSFALDKKADLDAIDPYSQFVTASGSCYELGWKKDTEKFYGSVHHHISNFNIFLDIPEPTIEYGASVAHVFYGTLVDNLAIEDPNKWVVKLDKVEQFWLFGGKIELDAKRYTMSRNTYLSLHSNSRRPSAEGEQVAVLFFGHVTLDPSPARDLHRPYSAQFFVDCGLSEIGPLAFFTFDETVNVIDFHSKLCPIYKGTMPIFLDNQAPYNLPNRRHTIKKHLFSDPDTKDNNFGENAKKTKTLKAYSGLM
jgi:hypothetical protein